MASGDSGDNPSKVATAAMGRGRGSIRCGDSKILLETPLYPHVFSTLCVYNYQHFIFYLF